MRLIKRREQVVGAWVTEFPDGHGGTIHHTSRNAPYRHQFCPNHPRQSPTAITHDPIVFVAFSSVWQSHGNH